jgi:hypothetical protein
MHRVPSPLECLLRLAAPVPRPRRSFPDCAVTQPWASSNAAKRARRASQFVGVYQIGAV